MADWRAETSLLLSCLLNELTFFLTLRPSLQFSSQFCDVQDRNSSAEQLLCLHDLLLL